MGQVSKKLRRKSDGYAHWCPACREMHSLPDGWQFDGNLEKPTFSPSFKHTGLKTVRDEEGRWTGEWVLDSAGKPVPECCHYILTAGVLHFCGDCTHEFAGRQVELPDLPPFYRDRGET